MFETARGGYRTKGEDLEKRREVVLIKEVLDSRPNHRGVRGMYGGEWIGVN